MSRRSLFILLVLFAMSFVGLSASAQDEDDESDIESDDGFVPDYSDYTPPDVPPPPPPPSPPPPSDEGRGGYESPPSPPAAFSGGASAQPRRASRERVSRAGVHFDLVPEGDEGYKRRPWPSRKNGRIRYHEN